MARVYPGNDIASVIGNDAPGNDASSESGEGQEEGRARKRAKVSGEGEDQRLGDAVRRTKMEALERRKRQEALASLMGVPVHPRARVPSAGLRTRAREHFVKRQLGMGMQPPWAVLLAIEGERADRARQERQEEQERRRAQKRQPGWTLEPMTEAEQLQAMASLLMGVPVHPRARVPSAGLRTREHASIS